MNFIDGPGYLPHGPHEQPLPISDRNPAGYILTEQQRRQMAQRRQQQQQQHNADGQGEGASFEENSTSTAAAAHTLKSAEILKNEIQDDEGDEWTVREPRLDSRIQEKQSALKKK